MTAPSNWPGTFQYSCSVKPVSFHDVFLDAVLGTGYEEDMNKIIPCVEEKFVLPSLIIEVIDGPFCAMRNKPHLLMNTIESVGHVSRGVFAKAPIKKGTVLGEYAGHLYYFNQLSAIDENLLTAYSWLINLGADTALLIDGSQKANELAFVNDYRNIEEAPNCEMIPLIHRGRLHFCYSAITDIQTGEELLVDYKKGFKETDVIE